MVGDNSITLLTVTMLEASEAVVAVIKGGGGSKSSREKWLGRQMMSVQYNLIGREKMTKTHGFHESIRNGRTDGRTNRRKDGRTKRTHLKRKRARKIVRKKERS